MGFFVLTNNPMVHERAASGIEVVFAAGGIKGVFECAARYIADGHRLLTHPLSGSVKPGETPYKSVLLAGEASPAMDDASARLISEAFAACDKFADRSAFWPAHTLRDLQMIDLSLIEGALESARCDGMQAQ